MPKLKPSQTEEQNRILMSNINGCMTRYGVGHNELAYSIRISPATLYLRLKKPEKFTLSELRLMAAKFHTTVSYLLEHDIQKLMTA